MRFALRVSPPGVVTNRVHILRDSFSELCHGERMREIHLICNAHLDPVWLWQWEEGAAEALSTFRIAADFCEQYDGFVFNHNEAVLYEWVEEFDPPLFARIQRLVAQRRWHIMGGWYLQPDCNLPSGESFIRQALYGRRYFQQKFGARPTTAINFDPFGHSRGLVQILAKCGYHSYVFCRPFAEDLNLPAEEFTWVGFDGSAVVGHRAYGHYLTSAGDAVPKIRKYLNEGMEHGAGMVLWGIGNHGGGPSREDLAAIGKLMTELADQAAGAHVMHSDLRAYFSARLREAGSPILQASTTEADAAAVVAALDLPQHADHLNPWAPGCYTSQIRIKQLHRRLENELYGTEKMCVQAELAAGPGYATEQLEHAQKDLMFCQFHDILPGSSIPAVEEASLARLGRGLDTVSRVRAAAMFALCRGEADPAEGAIPIFAYNPHPYPVTGTFQVEFQPAGQNRTGVFTSYRVRQTAGGDPTQEVPVQFEKESSSVGTDWRKRMILSATLPAASISRFDCVPEGLPERPRPQIQPDAHGNITVSTAEYHVVISTKSGLIESFAVDGNEVIGRPGPVPLVLRDSDDAWESRGRSFRDVAGAFRPASPAQTAQICGVQSPELKPVRVIEDGPVRTVVEAVFVYAHSSLVLTYYLPKSGHAIEVGVRVLWTEKRSMLKLAFPLHGRLSGTERRFLGQTAFGVQRLRVDGEEQVAQRWVAVAQPGTAVNGEALALTVINDGTYGCSMEGDELRLTLLRSPAYSGLPVDSGEPPIPQDRFTPRMDQGERHFSFWISAGPAADRLAAVDREACAYGEHPFLLMLYPSPHSDGSRPGSAARQPVITLSDDAVQLSALKRGENGGYVVRLFEPTGTPRSTVLEIPALGISEPVELGAFEVVTLLIHPEAGASARVRRVSMIEE